LKSRKNRGYKIPKYDRIFDSTSHRKKIKIRNTIIFIVVLLLLVFVGYSISGPLSNLLKGEKTERPESSQISTSSKADVISSQIASNEEETEIKQLSGVYLPLETAKDEAALAEFLDNIKSKGYNAVVLELKDEVGKIYFNSTNQMAVDVGAVSDTAIRDLASVVKSIKAASVTPIAQIHAFKDRIATKNADAKIKYKGNAAWSWLDSENGKPWLNPYSDSARKYIIDIALELTDLGFENVMVSSVIFPPVYSYSLADFGEKEKTISHKDMLSSFTSDLKNAVNGKKANLILNYDSAYAQDAENNVYGTADPKNFDADIYALDITAQYLSATENEDGSLGESALEKLINSFEDKNSVMIKITPDSSENAKTVKELCKDCSFYLSGKTQIF